MRRLTRTFSLLMILSLFFTGLVIDGYAQKQAKGNSKFTLLHQGATREYFVHAPSSYNSNIPAPLIIHLHGGGGSAEGAMEYSRMNKTADRHGFLVVYPQGTGPKIVGKTIGTWNAGKCCGAAMQKKVDDVGFIRSMIAQLKKDYNVNPKMIYATGLSNGAQMTYRIACELADQIAAIAPIGSVSVLDNCNPSRPMPVIHFHGTADPTAYYAGGTCGGGYDDFLAKVLSRGKPKSRTTWPCASVPDYMKTWKNKNGCANQETVTYEKGNATCVTSNQCNGNAAVTLCSIENGGHTWPGGTYGTPCKRMLSKTCRSYKEVVGTISRDISANEVMWEFFKEHPLSN